VDEAGQARGDQAQPEAERDAEVLGVGLATDRGWSTKLRGRPMSIVENVSAVRGPLLSI
jgi:hypothetical protein